MEETKIYNSEIFKEALIGEVLNEIIENLTKKGYDANNQIVGYLMSGDPGYISNYKDSRKKIIKFNRSDIILYLLKKCK